MDDQLSQELELLHSRVCHALGDPKRLRILYSLSQRPRYVSELAEELDLPQPTVSRHLKILRDRCMVTTYREGAAVYYTLKDTRVIEALNLLRAMLHDRLQEQAQLASFTALTNELESE
jgi:DNA-binding transcriptional ArsR family regulator